MSGVTLKIKKKEVKNLCKLFTVLQQQQMTAKGKSITLKVLYRIAQKTLLLLEVTMKHSASIKYAIILEHCIFTLTAKLKCV